MAFKKGISGNPGGKSREKIFTDALRLELNRIDPNDKEKRKKINRLAEKLVDIEDNFQHWRFSHVQAVKRIIGRKPGTGGSSGVPFLEKALQISFFPELYELRSII